MPISPINDPKDPFNSANICFARFVGRNYVWDVSSGIGKMIPVDPKVHPTDTERICAELPAPNMHPLQSRPNKSTTKGYFGESYGYAGRIINLAPYCGNIAGYPGIATYHLPDNFAEGGDEGGIPGHAGGDGKGPTVTPGRANVFAPATFGYTEKCIEIWKEATPDHCEEFLGREAEGCAEGPNSCPTSIGCSPDASSPYFLPNCDPLTSWEGGEGCWPSFSSNDQVPLGTYTCGDPDNEITKSGPFGDYTEPVQTSANHCIQYVYKRICDGYTGGDPIVMPGTIGAKITGGFTGNSCCAMKQDNSHAGDPSPNNVEWRNNAIMSFPPILITPNDPPAAGVFDYCKGQWFAESCCLWSEYNLGEFAVSGKNWLQYNDVLEGQQYINPIPLGIDLPRFEGDGDCGASPSYSDKRGFLLYSHFPHKGPCCVSACYKSTRMSFCDIMTKDECDGYVPDDLFQAGFDPGSVTRRWTYGGIMNNINCGTEHVCPLCPPGACTTLPCLDQEPRPNLPRIPKYAHPVRGKMICIENMVPDPEVVLQPNTSFILKKPIGVENCGALVNYVNNTWLKNSSCGWDPGLLLTTCTSASSGSTTNSIITEMEGEFPPNYECQTGECCSCINDYSFSFKEWQRPETFEDTCLKNNGIYRKDSRCPHGPCPLKLETHYVNHPEIVGYNLMCTSLGSKDGGPMTCHPGVDWTLGSVEVNQAWACPDNSTMPLTPCTGPVNPDLVDVEKVCAYFTDFLESTNACGLCEGEVGNYTLTGKTVSEQWAKPANPFDPMGYPGINIRILWPNTCGGDPSDYTFIWNGSSHQDFFNTRLSGTDGCCRSHIGYISSLGKTDNSGCEAWGAPLGNILFNTREITYSGPCWPCPHLYDSLGTEQEMYGATQGLTEVDSGKIHLGDGRYWTPCMWGDMRCQQGGIWTPEQDVIQDEHRTSDMADTGTITNDAGDVILPTLEKRCCSPSSSGYQDQIQITDPNLIPLACPDLEDEDECWRCPGWQFQVDPNIPGSKVWDGQPNNNTYYRHWHDNTDFTLSDACYDNSGQSICTIMEPPPVAGGDCTFVDLVSPNGRTMCYCHPPDNYYKTWTIGPGGPGCTADPSCQTAVCAAIPYCCAIQWDEDCAAAARIICSNCSYSYSHQECQNYDALRWCADKYNGVEGWTGGTTRGLDLFDCEPDSTLPVCTSCRKCDLPLCRHKYNCNLKCPCGTYGLECEPTCTDIFGSYGPYVKTYCDGVWPGTPKIY